MAKNLSYRKQLRQLLAEEAIQASTSLPRSQTRNLERETWRKIRSNMRQQQTWWEGALASASEFWSDLNKTFVFIPAMAIAVLAFVNLQRQSTQDEYLGIKDGQNDAQVQPTLVGLRFARVAEDGSLISGEDFMGLPLGATIVFYVEGRNISKNSPLNVRLDHELGDERDVLVENYELTQERQLLSDASDYFAYTLTKKGVHKFSLSNIKQKTDEKKDDVWFSVVATGP